MSVIILSLREELWAHGASLTPPLFIEVSLRSKESERSCICVLGVLILPLSSFFIFYFVIVQTVWYCLPLSTFLIFYFVPTVWYCFVFHFIHTNKIMVS